MSEVTDLDKAVKAKTVLESAAYQDAYKAVRESLIRGLENAPLTDVAVAEDLRRCLKLLNAINVNMTAAVQSGKLAEFRLAEEKRRAASPFRKIFRDKP